MIVAELYGGPLDGKVVRLPIPVNRYTEYQIGDLPKMINGEFSEEVPLKHIWYYLRKDALGIAPILNREGRYRYDYFAG